LINWGAEELKIITLPDGEEYKTSNTLISHLRRAFWMRNIIGPGNQAFIKLAISEGPGSLIRGILEAGILARFLILF